MFRRITAALGFLLRLPNLRRALLSLASTQIDSALADNVLALDRRWRIRGIGARRLSSAPGSMATDRQIDDLVYELYGLTEEEIDIVDDAAR
ncbi:MAG TPA: hypothetical protein PLY09_01220 [Methanothrix sp.]|nr:hypothetical protein [Methanothrix sp.]HPJ83365.1 hypothetical protein [Methanothrix sp.]